MYDSGSHPHHRTVRHRNNKYNNYNITAAMSDDGYIDIYDPSYDSYEQPETEDLPDDDYAAEPDVEEYEHHLEEPDHHIDGDLLEQELEQARQEHGEIEYVEEPVIENVIDDEPDIDDYEPDDDPYIDDYEPDDDPYDDLDSYEPPDAYDDYGDPDDNAYDSDYYPHIQHRCPSPPPAPPPPPPDPLRPDSTCAICLHALSNTVLIPCGHLVACSVYLPSSPQPSLLADGEFRTAVIHSA